MNLIRFLFLVTLHTTFVNTIISVFSEIARYRFSLFGHKKQPAHARMKTLYMSRLYFYIIVKQSGRHFICLP